MLGRVVVENGVKKIVPLTADCGSGNPVGTVIAVYSNKVPNGYLPCNGVQFDTAQFPVLYALLQDDHTPDLRECTLKGIGESGRTVGAHVKAGGLAVGEFVDDRVQNLLVRERVGTGSQGDALAMTGSTTDYENQLSNITTLGARTGATTEVKAVGVNWCIKATSGINENQADNVLNILQPVDVVALNNVHSVTSNAVARHIVNAVTNGEMKPVTSGAVYSAIRDFFNQSNDTRIRSANLNNVTYPLVSFDTDTQNKPTNWGVCYTFGRAIYSTEAGESRWYYQLVFGTNGNIYFRYAENPTSSSTTPDNWTSWKRIAFV